MSKHDEVDQKFIDMLKKSFDDSEKHNMSLRFSIFRNECDYNNKQIPDWAVIQKIRTYKTNVINMLNNIRRK